VLLRVFRLRLKVETRIRPPEDAAIGINVTDGFLTRFPDIRSVDIFVLNVSTVELIPFKTGTKMAETRSRTLGDDLYKDWQSAALHPLSVNGQ
jgi:hypothetical protein